MTPFVRRGAAVAAWLWPLSALAAGPPPEEGRAAVAADHALASACGAEVLERGGNAVDAAVAAALCAGVVQPAGSGLGGGGFALVHLPDGPTVSLDFREVAPAAAARDMFVGEDGQVIDGLSRAGGLAVAVPGEPRGDLGGAAAADGGAPRDSVGRAWVSGGCPPEPVRRAEQGGAGPRRHRRPTCRRFLAAPRPCRVAAGLRRARR